MMATDVIAARDLIDNLPDRDYEPVEDDTVFLRAQTSRPGQGSILVTVHDADTEIVAYDTHRTWQYSATFDSETPGDVILAVLGVLEEHMFGEAKPGRHAPQVPVS